MPVTLLDAADAVRRAFLQCDGVVGGTTSRDASADHASATGARSPGLGFIGYLPRGSLLDFRWA
jgi:hypothetical protein